MPELGCYGLAGHVDDPRIVLDEVKQAEALGLGCMWLSERFNVKELGVLSGAVAATSTTLGIATGVTNHPTRHPIVTASMATTLHRMTGGRFALGLGRGITPLLDAMGVPRTTMASMEDAIGIYRRLWAGETIFGHNGPAGTFPFLRLDTTFDEDIPVIGSALGEKTMRWAGRVCDGVLLHTFFSGEALARSIAAIRGGAEQAGKDPGSVRIWAVDATLVNPSHERRMRGIIGRMATYLQVYGDALVTINGWDPGILAAFRADTVVAAMPGAIDAVATIEQLEHIAGLLPDEWFPAAVGSPEACAKRINEQLALGADGVVLHGASPSELAPAVNAYLPIRDNAKYAGRSCNPGR